MIVTGWNNGDWNRSGAGYGLKVSLRDRDRHFKREWSIVTVNIKGSPSIRVKLSASFWRDCAELRSQAIGIWMKAQGHSHWISGKPPKFNLVYTGEQSFDLSGDGDPK
ncbi:MAG TPA: hypothetical protein VGK24_22100 [Candidatus Angelobacter sp.]